MHDPKQVKIFLACENIRFSSLFAAGDVSPAAKSEEKRTFSQATWSFCFCDKKCLGAVCHWTTIQRNFDQYETLRSAQEIDDPGIDDSFATQATEIVGESES